jgi:acetolactate synthase-1/3 small subunit
LFARRSFNIHSLAVGPSEQLGVSRITIVTDASNVDITQIVNQLYKLINVLRIEVLDDHPMVEREIILIKVTADAKQPNARTAVLEIVNLFRTKVVDISQTTLTIEATGKASKLSGLVLALEPYGIVEIVKSGTIAIARGSATINDTTTKGQI